MVRPFVIVLLLAAGLATSVAAQGKPVVVKGDTFDWRGERYQIIDIDAPEIERAKCPEERQLGLQAKAFADALFLGDVIVKRTGESDRAGRMLARVYVDGRDYSKLMVESGNAVKVDATGPTIGTSHDWCPPKATPAPDPVPVPDPAPPSTPAPVPPGPAAADCPVCEETTMEGYALTGLLTLAMPTVLALVVGALVGGVGVVIGGWRWGLGTSGGAIGLFAGVFVGFAAGSKLDALLCLSGLEAGAMAIVASLPQLW
ncbi:MAG: thermonuclease family protein [Alphaproteobacteria bacterium]|nr:thermonuclease family protein [Alphaproteobacteria bacterium]